MVFSRRQESEGALDSGGGSALFPLVLFGACLIAGLAVLYAFLFGDPDGGLPKATVPLEGPAAATHSGALAPAAGADAKPWTPTGAERVRGDDRAEAPGAQPAPAPRRPRGSLTPAPDPALVENGRHGPLPITAPDGRRPLDIYARPFDPGDTRPRIALVVGGLGLSRTMTDTAVRVLPADVTLSFVPYEKDLQLLIDAARADGHEVVLELPMEPFDYPHNDPGPMTLLAQADVDENLDKLEWLMSRFVGYAGVVSFHGEKLLGSPEDLRPILEAVQARGLYFLDRGTAKRSMVGRLAHELGLVWGLSVSVIDQNEAARGIDLRLLQLEEVAREKGTAIGAGFAFPVTIDRIKAWSETLDAKGLALAPLSAVVAAPQRQAMRTDVVQ